MKNKYFRRYTACTLSALMLLGSPAADLSIFAQDNDAEVKDETEAQTSDLVWVDFTAGRSTVLADLEKLDEILETEGTVPVLVHQLQNTKEDTDAYQEALFFVKTSGKYAGKALIAVDCSSLQASGGTAMVRDFGFYVRSLSGMQVSLLSDTIDSEHYDWEQSDLPVLDSALESLDVQKVQQLIAVDEEEATGIKDCLYRLYNPNSGEHFYTSNFIEKNVLTDAGWIYEGDAWMSRESSLPVYRLYNPNAGDHHYTVSKHEKETLEKAGWKYEGIGWYGNENEAGTKIYRAYNPNAIAGAHHFTASEAEYNALGTMGWKLEGEAWYSWPAASSQKSGNYIKDGYCYSASGSRLSGVQRVSGLLYYFDAENDGKQMIPSEDGFVQLPDGLVYMLEDGSICEGILELGEDVYYFEKNTGLKVTEQFVSLSDGYQYYFDKEGKLLWNTTAEIDGIEYVFNEKGQTTKMSDWTLNKLCEEVYENNGRTLKSAWNWLVTSVEYTNSDTSEIEVPKGWTREQVLAKEALESKKANTEQFAAAYAQLCINLGYPAKMVKGQILTFADGYVDHAWTEVTVDGVEYICDPATEVDQPNNRAYMQKKERPFYTYKEEK